MNNNQLNSNQLNSNQFEIQVDEDRLELQVNSNQIEIHNRIEAMIQLHNDSVLLLPLISANFVNQICYLLVIEPLNLGNLYPITQIMDIFKWFIKNQKLNILNNILPDWVALVLYTFESKLIRHAQTMNLYNNEFIDVINEFKTFLPNNTGILIWDLPNTEKDYILRNLDNDTFRELFTLIENLLNTSRNI